MKTQIPKDVANLVHDDIEQRIAKGQREYGQRLMTGNGRDALWDAYEEALDLVAYLRQAITERDDNLATIARVLEAGHGRVRSQGIADGDDSGNDARRAIGHPDAI